MLQNYKSKIYSMDDIPDNRKPLYIKWVEMFLNHSANRKVNTALSSTQIHVFIGHLRKNKNYSDWQIEQAMEALNIMKSLMATMIHPKQMSEDAVFEMIHKMIRLKHYSPKTVKSYVYWVRYFMRFNNKNPDEIDSGVNIRVVQELLGHSNIETTIIYTHVILEHRNSIKSPLDYL